MKTDNEAATKPLHGLVALNNLKKAQSGASRPISLAAPALADFDVKLHFCAVRSVVHFLHSLLNTGRLTYDFVLFNSLSSLSYRSLFGYRLWQIARCLKLPVFIYWHETDWALNRHERQHPASARRLHRIATDPSVVHLTVSEAGRRSLTAHFPSVEPVVVYNCTTVPAPFDRPVQPAQPPSVVNLASIQERKGTDLFVETAIQVCQRHPTVEFIWLGHGERFGSWQSKIERAGLQDRILFPGYVDAGHLILRRASLLFLSSRDDPFPLAVLEAMYLGRTIVTFDVGGAPEALAGEGYIISPFDTDAAASAILDSLDKSPEQRIIPKLRERYLAEFTPRVFAERLSRCLREKLTNDD
jgi:glycosyltransferase involved in cell wall biosynthesis